MSAFALHPRLAADTFVVRDSRLSRVLLMNDARYRWLVLVPRIADAVELFDLSKENRAILTEEIAKTARMLKELAGAAKINIGALGNLVPQLHVHIVARNPDDPAWPDPVWGHSPAVPYDVAARDVLLGKLVNAR
jgi:diadenosine tetraphosphate (Ap4A) HIT family hydrolase